MLRRSARATDAHLGERACEKIDKKALRESIAGRLDAEGRVSAH